MRVPDLPEEQAIAWKAILDSTPVYSSDREQVGTIHEVLGSDEEDIFHGIAVRHGLPPEDVMVPAEHVTRITNRRIEVDLTAEEVRDLPTYEPEHIFRLGLKGLFGKHLGWVKDDGNEPK